MLLRSRAMYSLTKQIKPGQTMTFIPRNRSCFSRLLALHVFAIAGLAGALAAPAWRDYANKPDDWYRSVDGRRVTENRSLAEGTEREPERRPDSIRSQRFARPRPPGVLRRRHE